MRQQEAYLANARGGAVTTMCNTPPPFQCSRDKIFLAGDFNINVLNHDSHCETDAFLNLMYSNKCFPVISCPTKYRIGERTETSVTSPSFHYVITGVGR